MRNYQKGFTLIELLVVIAIIGILSSVVLASLSTTRNKAKIGKFQIEMSQLRTAAETFYSNGSTYTGFITGGLTAAITGLDSSASALYTSVSGAASDGKLHGGINAGGTAYAIYGRIPGSTNTSVTKTDIWCIDSTGKSGAPTAEATTQFTDATQVTNCW
jgi:prepilin-type N-terminal cleavage/methylation domain-containing protein